MMIYEMHIHLGIIQQTRIELDLSYEASVIINLAPNLHFFLSLSLFSVTILFTFFYDQLKVISTRYSGFRFNKLLRAEFEFAMVAAPSS